MTKKDNLDRGKKAKADEFYTQYKDIEEELQHYQHCFKDKRVYLPADDPRTSQFWAYFVKNFHALGLKELWSTYYSNPITNGELPMLSIYDGNEVYAGYLNGDGDFRSGWCTELVNTADIVVTNPPFSLMREFINWLMQCGHKFLIISTINAVTYKEVFSLIQENKLWLGNKYGDMAFRVPNYYEERSTRFWVDENGHKWRSLGNVCWLTNLEMSQERPFLPLCKRSVEEYDTYDNADAINVNKLSEIPDDYYRLMGVPITFLAKYNPKQFKIEGFRKGNDGKDLRVNGKDCYFRVLTRRIQCQDS